MTSNNSHKWQKALINAVTDPKELIAILELDPKLLADAYKASKNFPLKVPRGFLARIKKGDINDPLLRQVLPLGLEMDEIPGYILDPLGESAVNPISGLLHKYYGRVLLTLTGVCGINCRYCFRRHFPYSDNNPGSSGWEKALEYIAKETTINEVILSGGDPLIANDALLQSFTTKLSTIPHIKRLRIHSRLPIVIPERITTEFIEWASQSPFKIILVIHSNHPQEINNEVEQALKPLVSAGITLLNQAVLLKGINDNAEVLIKLSERLFEIGVLPYYLHALDKVKGAGHFDLPQEEALALYQTITNRLPGYLIPKFVCEQAGKPAKTAVVSPVFYTV